MTPTTPDTGAASPHVQTLDRGVRLLEVLADATAPLSIGELTAELGLHRSIVYRMVRTLEDHHLVHRDPDGSCRLGPGLSTLARNVSRSLQTAALPELAAVANEVGMTCFLVVPDGTECVTLLSVEPRHSLATVVQRPGSRHAIDRGAPGLALLSLRPPTPDERPELSGARREGHASSEGEVIPGLASLAVPVAPRGELGGAGRVGRTGSVGSVGTVGRVADAAVCVVYVAGEVDVPGIVSRLRVAADRIAAEMD